MIRASWNDTPSSSPSTSPNMRTRAAAAIIPATTLPAPQPLYPPGLDTIAIGVLCLDELYKTASTHSSPYEFIDSRPHLSSAGFCEPLENGHMLLKTRTVSS